MNRSCPHHRHQAPNEV